MSDHANALLARLVGFRLYTVQFGTDHLQLRFETDDSFHLPFLDCDLMPSVVLDGEALGATDPGYADGLVSLVGREVLAAGFDEGVVLDLDGGSIALDPAPEDGEQVATLGGFDDGSSVVLD